MKRLLRDRSARLGLVIIAVLVLCAVFAGVLAPFPGDVDTYHLPRRLLGPSATNLFGTDRMGADIFSRLLFGARLTILIAVVATSAAVLIGVPVGLVAGYYNNRFSDLLMRVSDVFLAVPQIVLAIAIAQTLGPAIQNVILALSVTYWPFWARLVYAETRSLRNEVFIEAAVALGASPLRVMALHVLPSIASSVIVRTTIGMGGTILVAAALGFLGLAAAAVAGMGPHDRRKPRVPAAGLVVRHRARCRDPARGDGLQPAGRWAARRAGSTAAPGR
jgi:peptide/nickel transport system permease protein